ncbi:FDXHR family putative zinc-binding protein [Rhodococcus sp. no. 34]
MNTKPNQTPTDTLENPHSGEPQAEKPHRNPTAVHTNCCAATWTGLTTCHCSNCHTTFTSPSAFDQHRRRNHCLHPTAAGLTQMPRQFTAYGWPGTHPQRKQFT